MPAKSKKRPIRMMIKTYSDLIHYDTFDERFQYLKMSGFVGESTFGFDRHVNQSFYSSYEWKRARDLVILRDNGCDLGVPGYEINVEILIHHITPISLDDIVHGDPMIIDPENLITTTKTTHNAIHYGRENPYPRVVTARSPHDTRLW